MVIIKRDGSNVEYDIEKIAAAISGAFADFNEEFDDKAALDKIESSIYGMENAVSVEEIQDIVEDVLLDFGYRQEAKAYIKYRHEHELARQRQIDKDIEDKLMARQIDNQNANVDEHSFGGRIGEASRVVMKDYALSHCLSKMARENHLNNEIYVHDLDQYAVGNHNCLSIPFDKLLANGFNTRQTDVRPANSLNTAFQLVAVIFQLQSLQQFGGVSATHLDWTMVPYVRKSFYKHYKDAMTYLAEENIGGNLSSVYLPEEYQLENYENFIKNMPSIEDEYFKKFKHFYKYALDMTNKECLQAVEGMYHNLNTLQSRSGNQLPFTSINYGTCTKPEGRMVIDALLEVSIEGLGKLHKTSIFPCGIFQCMKGVNRKPDDVNYDLFQKALKSTAQRLYPNYVNVDWSNNVGYDPNDPTTYTSTMGKRKL